MSRILRRRATESALGPVARARESEIDDIVATGAWGGYVTDPIDGDIGYRPVNGGPRDMPYWTLEKARALSVAYYRANPMARAVLDTYTSFCVGDSGLTLQCSNRDVRKVAEAFWNDPRTGLSHAPTQDLLLRDHMLLGESCWEQLVGATTGVTRFSPIDPTRISGVDLDRGNPLWFGKVHIRRPGEDDDEKTVVTQDDFTGLRSGEVMFWPSWRSLLTDRRGVPFLSPILDWLKDYDVTLSNLIDRTALMRYFALDVEIDGGQTEIDAYIASRGGTALPRSGSVEVHNKAVKITPVKADVGASEDTETAKSCLTNIASGAGLARTWLADPEDANRATSLSMGEPVRRRVGAVQNVWIGYLNEQVRFAIDQAVYAGALPAFVPATDDQPADGPLLNPSSTVAVTGPAIAASDSEHAATMLVNLSTALTGMVAAGLLTPAAAKVAARKAWEQFVGIPYSAELDQPDGSTADDIAGLVDQQQTATAPALKVI